MKGDFSRIRFNPAKNYTAVLEQQGRVALDSEAIHDAGRPGKQPDAGEFCGFARLPAVADEHGAARALIA